ncbi:MAG: NAD-dependent epimerase/dehydratase family protein [Phycisphaerales bacterium]|nr:NAD-dependent epimerase/dehydratase family protein [Phycisphaerales bacterium]
MNILVLGGTQFSGRAFVEQASEAGHEVTVLHRSKKDPGLPTGVRRLVGDRDPDIGDGLDQIGALIDDGERFDAVVDMCGYVPRVVRASCELLKDAVGMYLFVSTISVYSHENDVALDEDAPLCKLDDPTVEVVDGATYGGLKVLCERVVDEVMGDKACTVRPCVIAGANDPTDRFTWWTRVLGNEEAMVVPSQPAGLIAFIDARDLAGFMLRCAEHGNFGVFNVVGPEPEFIGIREFIDRAHKALDSQAEMIECDQDRLGGFGVEPWKSLPLWLGEESQSRHRVLNGRAIAAGLTLRSLEDTVINTRAWDVARGEPELTAGMKMEQLREVVGVVRSQ